MILIIERSVELSRSNKIGYTLTILHDVDHAPIVCLVVGTSLKLIIANGLVLPLDHTLIAFQRILKTIT